MPTSSTTPNFGLPQYAADDIINFETDMSNAFTTIDTTMESNLLKAEVCVR